MQKLLIATSFSIVFAACALDYGDNLIPGQDDLEDEDIGVIEQHVVYNGHDYLFVKPAMTWAAAKTYCRLAGYRLVTINDAAEESFLQTQEFFRARYNWWIGLHDDGVEGTYIWDSGEPYTYTNWDDGQPDNHVNEDCVADRFQWESRYTEKWNDFPCDWSFPFICERNGVPTGNQGSFSYYASNTSNATKNTYDRSIYLHEDDIFTVGTCGVPGASGSGDTYLRIHDPGGQLLIRNDDAGGPCGSLSNISVIVPDSGTYTIRAGCDLDTTCSGTVAFTY